VQQSLKDRDTSLQEKEAKSKSNEALIVELNDKIDDMEQQIMKLVKDKKDFEFHKQNSSRMEKTAYAIDAELKKLDKEIVEHSHKKQQNEALTSKLENQVK